MQFRIVFQSYKFPPPVSWMRMTMTVAEFLTPCSARLRSISRTRPLETSLILSWGWDTRPATTSHSADPRLLSGMSTVFCRHRS